MKLDKDDIKHGIDAAAELLKDADRPHFRGRAIKRPRKLMRRESSSL